ncbi:glucosylceramidase [Mucilaginibacter gynuensis]|uniref:Glucosylceramidase n=1 Tax=Mucilaginibacter gynuensis TaxID=1302236 RepID=A0ABP8G780_9SPHI
MKKITDYTFTALIILALGITAGCGKKSSGTVTPPPVVPPVVPPPVTPAKTDVAMWLTNADQSVLFKKQNVSLLFSTATNQNPTIEVDTTQTYQSIDGFGFALTGGSASLINSLPSAQKDALIKELFATDTNNIGISYIRLTLGASDLSAAPFSYDEPVLRTTDEDMKEFTIDMEKKDLIPVIKSILAVNPNIKILACPWSAPTWMKDNKSFYGGSLKPEYFGAFAKYFVKYIQAMKAEGITIDAITPQNEPLNAYNNPSMLMLSADQGKFIKNNLGPAFKAANINTKIIIYDHNLDHPEYATDILKDADAAAYIDGSAFHLYAGNISTLNSVHNAAPTKNVYFTEQATFGDGNFGSDLSWHVSNLIVGATRNWSRNVIEWNLASDPQFKPHTTGGCGTCQGAITVGASVARNVSYYIIAHAAKFVRPGSVRIASNIVNNLQNVAFKTPDGKKALIVLNSNNATTTFNIKFKGKMVSTTLFSGAVATYVW